MGPSDRQRSTAARPGGERKFLIEFHQYEREKIGETTGAPFRGAWIGKGLSASRRLGETGPLRAVRNGGGD